MLSKLGTLLILFVLYHLLGVHYLGLHTIEWLLEDARNAPLDLLLGSVEILILCTICVLAGSFLARLTATAGRRFSLAISNGAKVTLELVFSLTFLVMIMVFVNRFMVGT